jgi:cation:H+ antiporter
MLSLLGLFIVGLLVLIWGAELLTRSGVILARQLGIAPIIIGLTIVALGTSAPELAVGIDAALTGNGALAVGNIAGTNTVNVLLILGLSALLRPLALQTDTLTLDLPAMLIAGILMLLLTVDGSLSRLDGGLLFAGGVVYTTMVVRSARRSRRLVQVEVVRKEDGVAPVPEGRNTALSLAQLAAGIILVVISANWLVTGAVGLARLWGVSDAFIGLTIVAIGTSAPELVTTVISTIKGERDVAIGNLIGSSVYNICAILGVTCLVPDTGIPVPWELIWVDIPIMAAVALVCVPVFFSGREVSRGEGGLFVAAYCAYLGGLLLTRT